MMNLSPTIKPGSKWHQDWQSPGHVRTYDARSAWPDRRLAAHYEAFNDVLLLGKALARRPTARLVEVGCATGELFRYLRLKHPWVRYTGVDVSRPALERAKEKYPGVEFLLHDPAARLAQSLRSAGLPDKVEVLYSKDVVHHQTDPFGFLSDLLNQASSAAVFRLRTRDQGPSVLDPELSCQYHYDGWMPYLVLNLQETIDAVRRSLPRAEVVVQRNHRVLGGTENRYLPKECYLPETGTAETAMAVLIETDHPGRVRVEDKVDMRFPLPWHARWRGRP